jgi:Ca2+-binding EF-hand superfamily protein
MLESEVYENNPKKITNDLIIAMLGATDTSRNVTFFALCHLTKSQICRNKVRNEIWKCMEKFDVTDTLKLGHKQINMSDFKYLN